MRRWTKKWKEDESPRPEGRWPECVNSGRRVNSSRGERQHCAAGSTRDLVLRANTRRSSFSLRAPNANWVDPVRVRRSRYPDHFVRRITPHRSHRNPHRRDDNIPAGLRSYHNTYYYYYYYYKSRFLLSLCAGDVSGPRTVRHRRQLLLNNRLRPSGRRATGDRHRRGNNNNIVVTWTPPGAAAAASSSPADCRRCAGVCGGWQSSRGARRKLWPRTRSCSVTTRCSRAGECTSSARSNNTTSTSKTPGTANGGGPTSCWSWPTIRTRNWVSGIPLFYFFYSV